MRSALPLCILTLACGAPPPPVVSNPQAALPETVVVVIGCTLRANHTTPYGYARDTTPYLAELAESGVQFDRMLSNSSWTRPSIGALITGTHPLLMGLDDDPHRAVPPTETTLAERFQAAGWSTLGITANPNANAIFGMDQGFGWYRGTDKRFAEGQTKRKGEEVVDELLAQVAQVEGKVYLQAVLLDAHHPWRWDPKSQLQQGHLPSKARTDRYDASLSRLDRAIAHLDAGLTALGRSNRLIVVVGDHGQGLKEPRWEGLGHGTTLYEGLVHVPLIFQGPSVAPGHLVEGLAQSIDLAPTLVEMVGLEADPRWEGRSHAAAVAGRVDQTETEEVFSHTRCRGSEERRLTTPEWTLIEAVGQHRRARGKGVELYRSSDRIQMEDLGAIQPAARAQIQSRAAALGRAYMSDARIVPVSVRDDEVEQLQALGYLDEEDPTP